MTLRESAAAARAGSAASELEHLREQEDARARELADLTAQLTRLREEASGSAAALEEARAAADKSAAEVVALCGQLEELRAANADKARALGLLCSVPAEQWGRPSLRHVCKHPLCVRPAGKAPAWPAWASSQTEKGRTPAPCGAGACSVTWSILACTWLWRPGWHGARISAPACPHAARAALWSGR
jgi:hypothetical protein